MRKKKRYYIEMDLEDERDRNEEPVYQDYWDKEEIDIDLDGKSRSNEEPVIEGSVEENKSKAFCVVSFPFFLSFHSNYPSNYLF